MLSRAGRPPKVDISNTGDTAVVKVKGTTFAFRMGNDGRLRAIGSTPVGSEEYGYAKQQVVKALGSSTAVLD